MKHIFFSAVFAIAFFVMGNAQKLSADKVKELIESKHYSFIATYVNPLRGGQKFLTQNYYLQVADDSVIAELPYFGVAYSAPINPSDAGYNFTSTNFDYAVTPQKKNSYEISIRTKDKVNPSDFVLTVYSNGKAFLRASNTQKQPISYNGYIKALEK